MFQLRITLFIPLIIFSYAVAEDSETVVSGTVFRNEKSTPLQGANVVLKKSDSNEQYGASSDNNGIFNLDGVTAGNYTIVISFIGYDDFRDNINIDEGKNYKIDAILSIEPILMTKLEIISEVDAPYDALPGAATVMGMEKLKLINPIGTQEMLEYVPGISGFADDGIGNSRISIGIRGLNPRRSSRVLILEDGIPIQPALYVYPNMYYNPPSDRIDRIEVIKGSGTILYGPQTMGGVINYFTRRPRSEFGGMLKVTSGENGYSSAFAEVGGWGNEKIKSEIQFLFKQGDGYRQNNSFEQFNGTLKFNYRNSTSKNMYLKANVNYENSNATYTGLTKYSFLKNPRYNPKEHDNFEVFRTSIDFIQTEKLSSSVKKTNTAFFSYFDRRWWRENDIFIKASDTLDSNALAEPYYSPYDLVRVGNGKDNFGILRTFYVAGIEQSYKVDHELFGYSSILETGMRGYWERFIDDRKTGFTADSVFSPSAREGVYFRGAGDSLEVLGTSQHYETAAFAAYISETIDFGTFTIRPGLRVEIFEQERVDRLAGSLYQDKFIYTALPGIAFSKNMFGSMIFGGFHRGFTPPSSGALKILNFGESVEDSGLDLEAEKSWNKELGVRGELSLLDYEIAGFHIDIENLVAAGRGTAFKNLGKVKTMGVEVRMNYLFSKISPFLPNFDVSYTFLSTEVIDATIISNVSGTYGSEVSINGKKLPYSPAHTVITGLELNPTKKFSIRPDLKYVSKVYTDFENIKEEDNIGVSGPVPEYLIFNISGNYLISEKMKIFISAKNVSDEIYIGSRLHSNPGQKEANISSGILPGPRRQVNLGIEYTF